MLTSSPLLVLPPQLFQPLTKGTKAWVAAGAYGDARRP